MGKTHFAENALEEVCRQMNIDKRRDLFVIQNDAVRKACLDQWRSENPRKSVSDGIKATA